MPDRAKNHYLERELYDRFREDSALFDFLQAGSLDGVWYWDIENPEHEWYSPRFAEVFGYSPNEIPNSSAWWQENIVPEDLATALESFEKHAADPTYPYDQVVRYRHKDGSIVWVRCRGLILRDSSGKPIRMLGAHTDVTELMRREQELRQRVVASDRKRERAEHVYELLYDSSPDMLVSVSPHDGTIKRCNATLLDKTGYAKAVVVGRPVFELYDPSCLGDARRAFEQFRTTGVVDNAELRLRCRDGSTIPVLLSVRAVRDENGVILESISTWRDISAMKRLASLEQLTQRLQESNDELERFAYVASHDLQEPLRMVTSYAGLLEARLDDRLDETDRKYLAYAVDGASRMRDLINGLLRFSRLKAEPLHDEVVNLEQVRRDVLASLDRLVVETGAKVDGPPLPVVRGTSALLAQVLQNLLANAIKFSPRGSARVTLSVVERQSEWLIGVADEGVGIDSKFHEEIFEVFRRLHARREYEGTGIGLAIARRIVERHGGRIWVESSPGAGSTFFFTLPRQESDKACE